MSYPEEMRKKGKDANPFFCLMGIEPVYFGDGKAALSMTTRPDMLNGVGWLQGGVYFALIDESMALAICTIIDDDQGIATISATTDYYKGVGAGADLVAEAHVVKRGHKIIFAEGSVHLKDSPDTILAKTSASFLITRNSRK